MENLVKDLFPRHTPGASVKSTPTGVWRLTLPAGVAGVYRWSQIDDYLHLPRARFRWHAPVCLQLDARVSNQQIAGTWGFGFWNDPFNISFGLGGMARRLPALPNTAWFFHASPPNYLALSDDHPAQGMLAATFSSPLIPPLFLGIGLPAIPVLAWPLIARLARRLARQLIREAAVALSVDVTSWHHYDLRLLTDQVLFSLDGELCFTTTIVPRGLLGLVIWVDNQYAAFPPSGALRFGTLENICEEWLELKELSVLPL